MLIQCLTLPCLPVSAHLSPQNCEVFHSRHPTTISMSVLVVVEMFNALNNLSEDASLLRVSEQCDLASHHK
jgi:hypothetical protein